MQFKKSFLLISIVISQLWGQNSTDMISLLGANGGNVDAIMMQQLLQMKKSANSTSQSQSMAKSNKSDSLSLLLPGDSVLMEPSEPDTLFYIMRTDTVDLESSRKDTSIVKRIGRLTSDPTQVVVRRRLPVSRTVVDGPERYEITFFRSQPNALFSSTTNAVNGEYPLKPGDKVVLTLWGEVEKEYSLELNNQGKVMIPGVGLISLAGLKLEESEVILRQKLAKAYSSISQGKTDLNMRMESLSPVKVFLVGECSKPGGYVYYGNTTIFQALYLAGGPSKLGSVRNIRITRGDSSFTLDLYDYLMSGKISNHSILLDGDIVFLPRASSLVEVKGAVGRPAIYELKDGEGIKEILHYASGVNVSKASQGLLLRRIFENGQPDFIDLEFPQNYISGKSSFSLQDGDVLLVKESSLEAENYVVIRGAVRYEGLFQYKPNMTVDDLIQLAGGVKSDVYTGRVQILSPKPKGGYQLDALKLEDAKGRRLLAMDTVDIFSAKKLYRADSVLITGAVIRPGYYEFREGMSVKDLIVLAGGFRPNREKGRVRLEHLKTETRGVDLEELVISDNYEVDAQGKIKLLPWDHLEVPVDPLFHRAWVVKLAGGFKQPGSYALLYPGEKMIDLIKRSGGFHEEAFLMGTQFYRKVGKIGAVSFDLTSALEGDTLNNIELQDLDSIYVPLNQIHVKVSGEVGYPSNVLYTPGRDALWYISQAGGFKETSDEDRVMIRYANGSVVPELDAIREPDPGSEVIVQFKQPPEPIDWYRVGTLVASMITASVGVLTLIFR